MAPLHRQVSSPRIRTWSRVIAGGGLAAVGLIAAAHYAQPSGLLVRPPTVVEVPVPAPPAPPAPDPSAYEAPAVEIGTCIDGETSTGDRCDPDLAADLVEHVTEWLTADGGWEPQIQLRRGIVFVETAAYGAGGPERRATRREAMRACGSQAEWLREHMRAELVAKSAYEDLECDDHRCCFGGGEWTGAGCVTFRRSPDETWIVAGWEQDWSDELTDEESAANARFLAAAQRRLAHTRCHGEPAESY
jgi:hypothetical protein